MTKSHTFPLESLPPGYSLIMFEQGQGQKGKQSLLNCSAQKQKGKLTSVNGLFLFMFC